MRSPLPPALPLLAALAASMATLACGGSAFTYASTDDASAPPTPVLDSAAPVESFCAVEAGTHTFCDDFDGPPLTAKWDTVDQLGGGTAADDSTTFVSSPTSFKAIAPASLTSDTRGRLYKAFGGASHVVVAFQINFDATPPKLVAGSLGGNNVVAIQIGSSYSIGIDAHSDEIAYFEDVIGDAGTATQLSGKNLVATATLTGWVPVVLTIDLTNATLSISLGGVSRVTNAAITPPAGQKVGVYLGAFSRNQASPVAAHYDNCTIDITP